MGEGGGRSPRLISDQLADRLAGKLDGLHHCLSCPLGFPLRVEMSHVDAITIDPKPDAIEVIVCLAGDGFNFGGGGHGVYLLFRGERFGLRWPHQ